MTRGAIIAFASMAIMLTACGLGGRSTNFVDGQPQACAWEGQDHAETAATDLGGGYVAQFREDSTLSADTIDYVHWRVTQCGLGQTLVVSIFRDNDPEQASFDDSALFNTFRTELAALSDPVTLQTLDETAIEAGLRTSYATEITETCGCAALYPELLGSQTPSNFRGSRQ